MSENRTDDRVNKALIVDDSNIDRLIYVKMLAGIGIESVQADNGVTAMTVLEADPEITFVLVDWNMPKMSGVELAQNIRLQQKFQSTKIVMITGRVEMLDVNHALEIGVDEYIMKPVSKEILREKLALLDIRGGGPNE